MRLTIELISFLSLLCFGLGYHNLALLQGQRSIGEELSSLGSRLIRSVWCRASVGAAMGWVLGNHWGAFMGTAFLVAIPSIATSIKRKREQTSLESQLLDGLSLMQGGLRAGFSLLQVLELVAREMDPPMKTIANRIIGEVQLGVPMDIAWERAGAETANETFSELVTAVVIQRQMGGDLGFILSTLRESLRQKINLKARLRSVTSQGRLTGIVVSLLPIALAGVIQLIMPQFIEPLFTSPLGQVLLGTALSLEVVGALMIYRICRIDT